MENRRGFRRHPTKDLKAKYFVEEEKKDWKECTIKGISYKGMGIIFPTDEENNVGSTIHLKVFTSKESESEYFIVKGILKWVEKRGNAFVGGIGLTELLPEAKWVQLLSFLIQDSLEEQAEDIRHTTLHAARNNRRHSPPPKAVSPTKLGFIKSILKCK